MRWCDAHLHICANAHVAHDDFEGIRIRMRMRIRIRIRMGIRIRIRMGERERRERETLKTREPSVIRRLEQLELAAACLDSASQHGPGRHLPRPIMRTMMLFLLASSLAAAAVSAAGAAKWKGGKGVCMLWADHRGNHQQQLAAGELLKMMITTMAPQGRRTYAAHDAQVCCTSSMPRSSRACVRGEQRRWFCNARTRIGATAAPPLGCEQQAHSRRIEEGTHKVQLACTRLRIAPVRAACTRCTLD